eukprot:14070589-Heterocapsa_arctica.AAC.1
MRMPKIEIVGVFLVVRMRRAGLLAGLVLISTASFICLSRAEATAAIASHRKGSAGRHPCIFPWHAGVLV